MTTKCWQKCQFLVVLLNTESRFANVLIFACETRTHLESGTLNQGPWIRDRRIEAGEAKQHSWLSTPPDRHLLDCSTKPLFPMFFVSCGGHCVKSLHWKTLQSLLFPLKHQRSCIMIGYMPLSFTSLEVLTYLVFLSRLDINFNPYLSQMKR